MLFLSDPWFPLCLLAGVLLDRCCGEPRRWHPLVGFGRLAAAMERRLNRFGISAAGRAAGLLGWIMLLGPALGVSILLSGSAAGALVHVLLLAFALGGRSLRDHIRPVAQAFEAGDLARARTLAQRVVSRDLSAADAPAVTRAALESTLENGGDAVFSTLFWFMVAGGPGALAHRLANTLDAMWGYRNPRFLAFGWAAARLDDALNYLPARLTALSYAALGDRRRAWNCWRRQAPSWDSPNAGPVMAAGAGALGVRLGGGAVYHGIWEERPPLGDGRAPRPEDIGRALRLLDRAVVLWLALALTMHYGVRHAGAWG